MSYHLDLILASQPDLICFLSSQGLGSDADRLQAVQTLERSLGRPLPAALRELAISALWPELLERFSNCDQPLALDSVWRPLVWSGYDPIGAGVLPFMVENQGVCTWAVRLGGSEDPAVVVELSEDAPPVWLPCADRFSDWLRCQIEDQQLLKKAVLGGQLEPLSADHLEWLRSSLTEGFHTYSWPAKDVLRFSSPLGAVLLWSGEDQCDWWIAPASEELAEAFLESLRLSKSSREALYLLDSES